MPSTFASTAEMVTVAAWPSLRSFRSLSTTSVVICSVGRLDDDGGAARDASKPLLMLTAGDDAVDRRLERAARDLGDQVVPRLLGLGDLVLRVVEVDLRLTDRVRGRGRVRGSPSRWSAGSGPTATTPSPPRAGGPEVGRVPVASTAPALTASPTLTLTLLHRPGGRSRHHWPSRRTGGGWSRRPGRRSWSPRRPGRRDVVGHVAGRRRARQVLGVLAALAETPPMRVDRRADADGARARRPRGS